MEKPVHHHHLHDHLLLLLLLNLTLCFRLSYSLNPSQYQTLLQIQQQLSSPPFLTNFNTDLCNIEPTPSFTLVCYQDNLTQLHITPFHSDNNNPHFHLPQGFSTHAFFSTIGAGLPSLKVLSLNFIGFWGPLPTSVSLLTSLEILNLSSNLFSGSIPVEISSLRNLQTLVLDYNKFSGQIPFGITSLPLLSVLSLKNNSLTGFLPIPLSELKNLRVLSVSRNNLTGEVPRLEKLTNLQVLDLSDNYFGPHFPILHHKKLVTLVLRNNMFQFNIPDEELISSHQLQKLDISSNGFVGPFPSSLLSLPSIRYLDIHGNKLTGMLLENISCNAELSYVDLSSNLLIGDLPTCLRNKRVLLYSRNCLSDEAQKQNPSRFCHNEALAVEISRPTEEKNKAPNTKSVLASSMVGGTLGGIAVIGMLVLVVKRVTVKKSTSVRLLIENVSTTAINTAKLLSDAKHISQTMKLGASLPPYRTFLLEELKEATNNFDASNHMSEDSDAQIYRGTLADGSLVAIRSLKMRKRYSAQTYTHHVELISKLRHSHLASVLGHCFECYMDDSTVSTVYFIFEFVPDDTLRSYVCEGSPGEKLSWRQRISAAIGVAKAVQFLHTGIVPGVYINNIKITDVCLDHNLHVKIRSYNLPLLAEMGSAEVSSTCTKASFRAREQHEDKMDVYDLGVILLEIITGRPITSQNEIAVVKELLEVSLTIDYAAQKNIIDPAVIYESSDESLKTMMELCVRCLSNEQTERPSVEDVLWNLQFAAQVHNSLRGDSEQLLSINF